VTAGTTYVASYFAPDGNYSYRGAAFANLGVTNGPLTAPQSSAVTPGNGVYNYGGSASFPNSTYNAANYWVDVVFTELGRRRRHQIRSRWYHQRTRLDRDAQLSWPASEWLLPYQRRPNGSHGPDHVKWQRYCATGRTILACVQGPYRPL
jgi:uncharacterized protein DUF4082